MNEKKETFENIFIYLKNKYKFNPKNFISDFLLSQVQALKKVFFRCNIHCCFFHYWQSIRRNFKKYKLTGKGNYDTNYELLLNHQILCFIKKDEMELFYDKIKNKFKESKFKPFFKYFTRTWMGSKIPKSLLNFSDILEKKENSEIFHFTNILTENINRYLNSRLKRAVCSTFLFWEIILDVIVQFKIKTSNDILKDKKTDVLNFYIDNYLHKKN